MNFSDLAKLQQHILASLFTNQISVIPAPNSSYLRLPSSHTLALYRNSSIGRMTKALATIYPVCKRLVGNDFFQAMTENYILENPSTTYDLNRYGESLPAFIRTFQPAASLPYLADVGSLEWAYHQLYFADDPIDFDYTGLSSEGIQDPQLLFLDLMKNSTLITSPYPLKLIWEMNQNSSTIDNQVILKNDQTYYFYIYRGSGIHLAELSRVEWQILYWLKESINLEVFCTKLTYHFPQLLLDNLLVSFIQKKWIVGFHLNPIAKL